MRRDASAVVSFEHCLVRIDYLHDITDCKCRHSVGRYFARPCVWALLRCCVHDVINALHDTRKETRPQHHRQSKTPQHFAEQALEGAVRPLYQPLGLRSIGRSERLSDALLSQEVCVAPVSEFPTIIRPSLLHRLPISFLSPHIVHAAYQRFVI